MDPYLNFLMYYGLFVTFSFCCLDLGLFPHVSDNLYHFFSRLGMYITRIFRRCNTYNNRKQTDKEMRHMAVRARVCTFAGEKTAPDRICFPEYIFYTQTRLHSYKHTYILHIHTVLHSYKYMSFYWIFFPFIIKSNLIYYYFVYCVILLGLGHC